MVEILKKVKEIILMFFTLGFFPNPLGRINKNMKGI